MISVIIPAYNNENVISLTIRHLKENAYARLLKEIIVVDAGSSDKTVAEAESLGAIVVHSIRKNRSSQMNLGVQHATGKILYFILPGSLPPKNFTNEIVRATQKGFSAGCFRVNLAYQSQLAKFFRMLGSLKTSFSRIEDQSLFVIRELFEKAGQFREDLLLLEDHELISRLKRYSGFILLRDRIFTPAKQSLTRGIARAEFSWLITSLMYGMGYPQEKLLKVFNFIMGKKKETLPVGKKLSTSVS
jgi:glycosyltransferase involved in cell wall biosynthesis